MSALAREQEDITLQIDRCLAQIYVYQDEIKSLTNELKEVDSTLEEFADERQRYELLSSIGDNLEKLDEIGASSLFWAGLLEDHQVSDRLKQLRDKAAFFERRIKKVIDKQQALLEAIREKNSAISYLLEDIDLLKEQEEENQNNFIIERETAVVPARAIVLPWTKKGEDEKKYRKILLIALLISLLISVIVPLWQLPPPEKVVSVPVPERLAKMIKQRAIKKPKPKPIPKKPEELKKEKKKPTEEERKMARKKVQNKGVLAFRNNLADLLQDTPEAKLGANASLNTKGSVARHVNRHLLTAQANQGSGGIRTSALSHDVAGTGQKMSAVAFSRVESDIGTAADNDRPLSSGPGPARTDEEIQIVFDRYKATLYRIYNRELRVNPTLQGKVVLRITIEPDGTVSLAKVESTDMDAKDMLAKIVERVKRFNFGPKDGVPRITILYPIDFLPAS